MTRCTLYGATAILMISSIAAANPPAAANGANEPTERTRLVATHPVTTMDAEGRIGLLFRTRARADDTGPLELRSGFFDIAAGRGDADLNEGLIASIPSSELTVLATGMPVRAMRTAGFMVDGDRRAIVLAIAVVSDAETLVTLNEIPIRRNSETQMLERNQEMPIHLHITEGGGRITPFLDFDEDPRPLLINKDEGGCYTIWLKGGQDQPDKALFEWSGFLPGREFGPPRMRYVGAGAKEKPARGEPDGAIKGNDVGAEAD